MRDRVKLFFLISLVIGFLLRIWMIGSVPPSPDWDEAALGYNAYSILTTGKDEYGKYLPIVLQSFNDYKPALYVYLVIPFVILFDVSIVAVRLPSVVFGLIALAATYFLVKEITNNTNYRIYFGKKSIGIAELSMLLMAISPWHINFSRIGFEANVSLTFTILFLLFLLKGLKTPWYLLLSSLSAAATIYTYQSAKVYIPLLLFVLIVIFFRELKRIGKKWLFSSALLLGILLLPMAVYILTTPDSLMRARGLSVLNQNTYELLKKPSERSLVDSKNNDIFGMVIDNRRVVFAKTIVAGYLSHFNLNWLFIQGDSPRHHAPYMGLLYLIELPLFLIGLYSFTFSTISRKMKLLVFSQILLTPIAASIAFDVPSSVRTLTFLPALQILIAFGIASVISFAGSIQFPQFKKLFNSSNISVLFLSIIFVAYAFNVGYYLNQYFVQYNYFFSEYWQYGYKEVVEKVKLIENNYEKIVVENRQPMDQSYMFFLYYLKYPPVKYQQEANLSGSFDASHTFDKYEFRPINWSTEKKDSSILYIGSTQSFPQDISKETYYYLNGLPAIQLVKGDTR